jgi:predicted RNA-binding protein
MSNWIFVVTSQGPNHTGRDIYRLRMEDQFWGLGERTPNRRNLKEGDRVVFYVGLPEKVFAGTAQLASDSYRLTAEEASRYSHGRPHLKDEYGVRLSDIESWEEPRPVEPLAPALDFIENEPYWYSYFQGGVREITDDDYLTIVHGIDVEPDEDVITSEARFALELHLEEFIYNNWHYIDWGNPLELYAAEDQDGRQFPAGTWSIDFLAVDRETGELVVIELKRGQTSDATVGQVLRYMGWVRANLAEEGQ